jgi:putative pyruvate formate lyase activating enzyme
VTLLEEHEIAPTYEIYFTGCSLRCRFCTVPDAIYEPDRGPWTPPAELAASLLEPDVPPFRSVALVGGDPSVNRPYVLALLPELRARLPEVPLVLNTNLYFSRAHAREYAAAFDVVVGDVHFHAAECARRVAGARDYPATAMAAAEEVLASGGRLFLRVLVLPGHLECCARPTLEWAAGLSGDLTLNLMTHYAPAGRASGHPTLGRALSPAEVAAARSWIPERVPGPRPDPLGWSAPRRAAHRDPETPVEIDASGRVLLPFVTGDLLPLAVEASPSLRGRLRYLNIGAAPLSEGER